MFQKNFSISLLAWCLLTACTTQPVTPTRTVIPPPTSTLTPTETPIPTPTDILFSPELTEIQEKFNGNYKFSWSKNHSYIEIINTKTGKAIPEIQVDVTDPTKPTWSRIYNFEISEERIPIAFPQPMDKITLDDKGKINFDFPGYVYNNEIEIFERKLFKGESAINRLEADWTIIKDGDSTLKKFCRDNVYKFLEIKYNPNSFKLKYREIYEPVSGWYFISDTVPIKNQNGDFEIINTVPYSINNFSSYVAGIDPIPFSFVVYRSRDGKDKLLLVDLSFQIKQSFKMTEEKMYLWNEYFANHPIINTTAKITCE